jgi:hypothetical protein
MTRWSVAQELLGSDELNLGCDDDVPVLTRVRNQDREGRQGGEGSPLWKSGTRPGTSHLSGDCCPCLNGIITKLYAATCSAVDLL